MTEPLYFQATDRVVSTDLPDGTAVLLHLDTKLYFTLNATAAMVFRELSRGPTTRARLATTLATHFACTDADAERDVAALLDDLVADALVFMPHA